MSKKLATICDALVLDVKVGSGAFMKTLESGHELAQTMVEIGEAARVSTMALLTDMSTPLGLTAGNALEVSESVEVLAGGGLPTWLSSLSPWPGNDHPVGRDDHEPAICWRLARLWTSGVP